MAKIKTTYTVTAQLTNENAKEGLVIINNNNPEWGIWRMRDDCGDWFNIVGDRGSRVLFADEYGYWSIVKL